MIFYVDGACSGNPGPGGFAVIGMEGDKIEYKFHESESLTTNNRMELSAILHVMRNFGVKENQFTLVPVVYTDSAYALNTFTDWMFKWADNGWKRSKGQNIENIDLIRQYYNLYKMGFRIELRKVKGHSGILGNELVDKYAKGEDI